MVTNSSAPPEGMVRPNRWAMRWRWVKRNPLTVIGGTIVAIIILVALLAPVLAPRGFTKQDLKNRRAGLSWEYPLGTDELGRSTLDRLIWGARISVTAGVVAVALGMFFGVSLGMIAAYFGGKIDLFLMRSVDIMLALPFLLWAIVVVSAVGASLVGVIVAIATWSIPSYARLTRSLALSLKENLYVEAARSIGVSNQRIMLRHILPNALGPIIVETSLAIGLAILVEAGLSFLGLGVPPPNPSWGTMLLSGKDHMRTAPLVSVWPGLVILITVLAFNLLGEGLRDAIDPKSRRRV